MDSQQNIQEKPEFCAKEDNNLKDSNVNQELNEYAMNQCKFERKIKQLNALAAHYLNQDQINQALTYLNQAQKILQYVSNYGKTIDKVLIITTLQNLACSYQKLDQLQKSSAYMQTLIANIEPTLDNPYPIQINENSLDQRSTAYSELNTMFNNRVQGILYYLQYSAVSSQINHHNLSLETAKSSLKLLEDLCRDCLKYEKGLKGKNSILLQELVVFFKYKEESLKHMLIQTKSALNQIKKHRHFFSFDSGIIQNFMIGQVMQLNPTTVEQKIKKKKLQDHISHLGLIYKVFYLSICYFVMSTQFRLISNKKVEQQNEKPKLFHLYSIKIVAALVPCQSKYLTHLIQSFKNHYKIDLTSDDYLLLEEVQFIDLKENKTSKKSKKKSKIKINTFESQDEVRLIKTPNALKGSPLHRENTKKQRTLKGKLFQSTNNEEQENCYAFPKKAKKRKLEFERQSETKTSIKKDSQISLQEILQSKSLRKNKKLKSNKEYLFPECKTIKKKKNHKTEHRSKSKDSKINLETQKIDKGKV